VGAVLDHLAGFGAQVAGDHPAWRAAEVLAEHGAWIKLSGWYRLGAQAPYARLVPHIRRLAGIFGDRMVWGSDWPHTAFAPEAMPPYAESWQPVVDALGRQAADALRVRHPAIYC
jgi:predicted TIM-barrel fold metal-dependent hydrolase